MMSPAGSLGATPAKDDRTGIIGAGPAGIYMAHLLSERGFRNIELLERRDRFGGMTHTVHADGVPHEMGTCYLHPGYHKVLELLKLLKMQAPVRPAASVGRNIFGDGGVQDMARWILGTSGFPALRSATDFVVSIQRYNVLHRTLMKNYQAGQVPVCSGSLELRQPFAKLLRAHGLEELLPLFLFAMSIQGYGDLETTPAYYGMLWLTPEFTTAAMRAAVDAKRPLMMMLPQSWGEVWRRLVARHDLEISLGAEVTGIERDSASGIRVTGQQGSRSFERNFEHLIVAAPLHTILPTLAEPNEEESLVFSALRPAQMSTLLFKAEQSPEGGSVMYWPGSYCRDAPGQVYCIRDSARALSRDGGAPTFVSHQYAAEPLSDKQLLARAQSDLDAYGFKGVQILRQSVWFDAPRFSAAGLQVRMPQRLDDLQGHRQTWFVGGACFESVHDITCHASRLI